MHGKFYVENLTGQTDFETIRDCEIIKIGRFQKCDNQSIAHFALNIREKRDVAEETFAIMNDLVGDGAIVVTTPHHSTLLIPPFSELNIFAWRIESGFLLFNNFQEFRKFADLRGMSLEVDRIHLTQFLASDRISNRRTAFTGLEEIEHACSITVLTTGSQPPIALNHLPRLFCQPTDVPENHWDAAAQVRALTADAIRAKAGSHTTGIATSGGFDSSLIALIHGREFPEQEPILYL